MRSSIWVLALAAVLSATGAVGGEVEDTALAQRIANRLKTSGRMRDYSVGVVSRNGRVWMSGNVANAQQKAAAIDVARRIPGVAEVVDRISVRQAAAPAPVAVARPAPQATRPTSAAPIAAPAATAQPVQLAAATAAPSPAAVGPVVPRQAQPAPRRGRRATMPRPYATLASAATPAGYGGPMPAHVPGAGPASQANYDQPQMPGYAWPSYASYPNYGALTYPKQYSPSAWPYIGPFYPYPQVPLGWRKVTLEWDDGWWQLDFKD